MYQMGNYSTARLCGCKLLRRKRIAPNLARPNAQFGRNFAAQNVTGGRMAITIREASSADAQLIVDLITELARYEQEEDSVKVTAADLYRQMTQERPPFACAIAENDGRAVGFALYFFAYSTWEGKQTLYLEDLYVSPEFRGTGAGAKLMGYLADVANERNCARFEWSVLDWNTAAIGFYNRIGAKPVAGWTRYRVDPKLIAC